MCCPGSRLQSDFPGSAVVLGFGGLAKALEVPELIPQWRMTQEEKTEFLQAAVL